MKKGDLILLVALLAILSSSWLYISWVNQHQDDKLVAVIKQDGKIIKQIDLSLVTEPVQFTVDNGQGGYNIIAIRPGQIRVLEANCSEQVDVRQGWISLPTESLVCLPHRLVIELTSSKATDLDMIVR